MKFKKISLVVSSLSLISLIFSPVTQAASKESTFPIVENIEIESPINNEDLISQKEFSKKGYKIYLENKEGSISEGEYSTFGLKKDAVVFALRHGGSLLGDITEMLSSKNGKLVREYSNELADELDRLTNSIEANLIQFMYHELDFSLSSSRTIAWAICYFAL